MNCSGSSDCVLLEKEEELEQQVGIPICGANLSTPALDTSNFISEIHYQIGDKYTSKMRISLDNYKMEKEA